MQNIIELLSQPWPWYVAGPCIGLMVPLLLLLLNKNFGISSSLRDGCAIIMPKKMDYFNYNWRKEYWKFIFVLGIVGGAVFVYYVIPNTNPLKLSEATLEKLVGLGVQDFTSLMPRDIFTFTKLNSPRTLIMVIGGGFLIGFGTRYANGCTSGHSIMGLSQLSMGSLVATAGFFIGGLIVSWFLLPIILSLP